MKSKIQRSDQRGSADYGWLKARYSFSFANYYDKEHLNFGALRVLNDDRIDGGMGFGVHPHDNMEIITIPLEGALKHKDSMSNEWKPLLTGEVQVMSAGTGIMHSEMNNSTREPLKLFQIWVVPDRQNVSPRYDQKAFSKNDRQNKIQHLVSSIDGNLEGSLKVHQNVLISRLDLSKGKSFEYQLNSIHSGVYMLVIQGSISIDSDVLYSRDAIGITNSNLVNLKALDFAELLFIEVPVFESSH